MLKIAVYHFFISLKDIFSDVILLLGQVMEIFLVLFMNKFSVSTNIYLTYQLIHLFNQMFVLPEIQSKGFIALLQAESSLIDRPGPSECIYIREGVFCQQTLQVTLSLFIFLNNRKKTYFKINFYWSIVALQCCVSFYNKKKKSAIHIHISPPSPRPTISPPRSSQSPELSSLS